MRVQYLCLALFAALYSTHSAAVSLGQDGPTEHRLLRAEAPNASGGQEGADNGMGEERALFQAFEGLGARIGKTIGKVQPKSDGQSKILKAAAKQQKSSEEKKFARFRKILLWKLRIKYGKAGRRAVQRWNKEPAATAVGTDRDLYKQMAVEIATVAQKAHVARKAAEQAKKMAAKKAAKEAAAAKRIKTPHSD
uniref:RxLR effector protein n=1 Tax=Peronospora matthiolae TaxID=2874970 RepID=A0AAV1URM9_9STRA